MSRSGNEDVTDPDRHAAVITREGVYWPSGFSREDIKVRDVDQLSKLLSWRGDPSSPGLALVQHPAPHGVWMPPQVWLVGELVEMLGLRSDVPDDEEGDRALKDDVEARLKEFIAAMPDWDQNYSPSGGWAYIKHRTAKVPLTIILEPYAHLTSGNNEAEEGILGEGDYALPPDDEEAGQILAARIHSTIELFGVMPQGTWSRTGALLFNKINLGMKPTKDGAYPVTATYQEHLTDEDPQGRFLPEKAFAWSTDTIDPEQLAAAVWLVVVDQRAAYLSSAQTDLGWGPPRHIINTQEATTLASAKTIKPGWHRAVIPAVLVPAGAEYMPVPAPASTEHDVTAWITTPTLKFLKQPFEKGGIDYRPEVLEAWTFPFSGRPLRPWVETLKTARIASRHDFETKPEHADDAFRWFIKQMYTTYFGRISNPSTFPNDRDAPNRQPYWNQAIISDTRGKAFIYAAKVLKDPELGLTPVSCATDAWTYLVSDGQDLPIDNDSETLGKYKQEAKIRLTAAEKKALGKARGRDAIKLALQSIKERGAEEASAAAQVEAEAIEASDIEVRRWVRRRTAEILQNGI